MQNISSLFSFQSKLLQNLGGIRFASKKAGGSAKWQGNSKGRPKHRGWKRQDGNTVTAGTILVIQNTLRFFPGLNVGFGKTGNLFAIEPGKVKVTCELADPNFNHSWLKRLYASRANGPRFYKKYFNVIPEPQHNRFKLVDSV